MKPISEVYWYASRTPSSITGVIKTNHSPNMRKNKMQPFTGSGPKNNVSTPIENRRQYKTRSNKDDGFSELLKERFKIFNNLNDDQKTTLFYDLNNGKRYRDEQEIRRALNIPIEQDPTSSYLDMYEWERQNRFKSREQIQEEDNERQIGDFYNTHPVTEPMPAQNFNPQIESESTSNPPIESESTANESDQEAIIDTGLEEENVPESVQQQPAETPSQTAPAQSTPSQTPSQPAPAQTAETPLQVAIQNGLKIAKKENKTIERLPTDNADENEEEEPGDDDSLQKKADKVGVDTNFDPNMESFFAKSNSYPFKTKKDIFEKMYGVQVDTYHVPDKKLVNMKQYYRPTYSPKPNAYQMDIMFTVGSNKKEIPYLVLINTNTRYLFVKQLHDKSCKSIIYALNQCILEGANIDYVNGDAEPGFLAMKTNLEYKWYIDGKITEYKPPKTNGDYEKEIYTDSNGNPLLIYQKPFIMNFHKGDYTFHNKVVDSVIRTIRNAAGLNPSVLRNNEMVQRIVFLYNNSPHNSLLVNDQKRHYTPAEMQRDINLEWEYIRAKDKELRQVYKKLKAFHSYKPGNVLLLHLNWKKTQKRFQKRRMNFENIGIFKEYVNGNALVYVMKLNKTVEVPLFFTEKVAENIFSPECTRYKQYYGITDQDVSNLDAKLLSSQEQYEKERKENETSVTTPKETNKETTNETPKQTPKQSTKETPKETPNETTTNVPQTDASEPESESESEVIIDPIDSDEEQDNITTTTDPLSVDSLLARQPTTIDAPTQDQPTTIDPLTVDSLLARQPTFTETPTYINNVQDLLARQPTFLTEPDPTSVQSLLARPPQ